MNYDDYIELYHSDEDWYFEYVNRELEKIKTKGGNLNEHKNIK